MLQYFKSRTFAQAFLTFFLLLTILLAAFWGILFGILQNSERQKQIAVYEQTAQKMKLHIDDTLGVTYEIAHYLQSVDWTYKLMSESDVFAREFDYSRRTDLTQQLLFFSAAYPAVRHIAILYPQQEVAVTSQGWFPAEDYFHYAQRSYDLERSAFEGAVMSRLCSKSVYNFGFDYQTDRYLVSMQNLEHAQQPRAILICVLSCDGIRTSLANLLPPSMSRVVLLDANEEPVLEYEAAACRDGYHLDMASDLLELRYHFSYQLSPAFSGKLPILIMMLFFSILLGMMLSFLLAKRSYRPVQKLVNHFRTQDQQAAEVQHEYEFLEQAFDSLRSENSGLQKKIGWYGSAIRASFLLQLLQGCFDRENISERLRQLDIPFTEKQWFTVLLLHASGETHASIAQALPVLKEYFSDGQGIYDSCEVVDTFENGAAVICCSEGNVPAGGAVELAQDELHQLLRMKFHITCGAPYEGILGISKSYQDAKRLHDRDSCELYYPDDWKRQLSAQLKEGNWEMSQNILAELYLENKVRHMDLSGNGKFLQAVLETAANTASEAGCSFPAEALKAGLLRQENPADAWNDMLDAAQTICRFVNESSAMQIQNLHKELLRYVTQNYCSSSLSLKNIGEKFGLSVATASRLFKEAAGRNFHDYVTSMRMEKAKKLLSTIHYNIPYIAKAVGYENEYSFKRAFLHNVGIKPRQYAQENEAAENPSTDSSDIHPAGGSDRRLP